MLKAILVLFCVPFLVSAQIYTTPSGAKVEAEHPIWQLVKKEYILPSGLKYVAENLVPVAHADTITEKEEIEVWILAAAKRYGISEDLFLKLAKCESGLDIDILGDKNRALGLYQWWEHSWAFYNKKYKTNLDRNEWQDQIEMSAKVISLEGYDDWRNCYYFIRFNKWPK